MFANINRIQFIFYINRIQVKRLIEQEEEKKGKIYHLI